MFQRMRNWTRLYSISNKKQLEHLSKKYFDSTSLKLSAWLKGIKEGRKGNLLTVFILSLVTGVHCCLHLKQQKYWTTLKEKPSTYAEFMQRCNVHLAYLGHNNSIELTLRTTKVSYKFFGIDNPVDLEETVPVVIGTLTSEESSTLNMLIDENPHPMLESADDVKSGSQPQDDVLGPDQLLASTAEVTHKNQDAEEMAHSSNENMTREDEKSDLELNLITHDNDDSDITKICDTTEKMNKGSVQVHTSPVDITPKNKGFEMTAHTLKVKNTGDNTTVDEELKSIFYVEVDSDSTIIYDTSEYMENNPILQIFPDTDIVTCNTIVSSNVDSLPATTMKSANTSKQIVSEIESKTTPVKPGNKTLRSKMQKPRVHEIEKAPQIKKNIKQGVVKINYQQTKAKETFKKTKETIWKDTSSGTSPKFTYSSHKLPHTNKKKYIFRCPIMRCKKLFNSVKNWNSHHLSKHGTIKYQCSTCLKWIATPNRFNNHNYLHQEACYKCGRCNKTFYFMSSLQLHKNLH